MKHGVNMNVEVYQNLFTLNAVHILYFQYNILAFCSH